MRNAEWNRQAVEGRVNSWGSWTLQHRLSNWWHTGLVALWHVGSSQIRDQTHVSCIGRWILYHGATREAPRIVF